MRCVIIFISCFDKRACSLVQTIPKRVHTFSCKVRSRREKTNTQEMQIDVNFVLKMLLRNSRRKIWALSTISLRKGGAEFLMYRMSASLPAAIRIFNQGVICLARAKHMLNMAKALTLCIA